MHVSIRHSDLYYNEEDYNKAVVDLSLDKVYDQVLVDEDPSGTPPEQAIEAPANQETVGREDSFSRRR